MRVDFKKRIYYNPCFTIKQNGARTVVSLNRRRRVSRADSFSSCFSPPSFFFFGGGSHTSYAFAMRPLRTVPPRGGLVIRSWTLVGEVVLAEEEDVEGRGGGGGLRKYSPPTCEIAGLLA